MERRRRQRQRRYFLRRNHGVDDDGTFYTICYPPIGKESAKLHQVCIITQDPTHMTRDQALGRMSSLIRGSIACLEAKGYENREWTTRQVITIHTTYA